jgi:hypothetical protein
MEGPQCDRAGVQILANRPLGNGSPAVCDDMQPMIGGVPAVPSLEFGPSQMVSDAINDLAGRMDFHVSTGVACTFDELGNFSFVDPRAARQFCSAPAVGQELEFGSGQTRLRAQLMDDRGTTGNQVTIVVRVP